jgi:murein DD-endopeptidase MepM/ murein hydrolase activator NlpD
VETTPLVRARTRPVSLVIALVALALAGSAGTYTVRWGDTLGGIARQFGVAVQDLVAANGLRDPDHIREGQVLNVPIRVAGQLIAAATPAPAASPGVVRVGRGETLSGIAGRHGTTVAAIASANGITDVDHIREGTVLRLPAGAAGAVSWVCPVRGPVHYVGRFGESRGAGRMHQGVDIAAARGTPVYANVAGVVERHPNPRGGNAYYLHGDDGDTYYGAHLDTYTGSPGRVGIGQQIGTVGSTGNAVGGINHLHFERMPKGGASVDPMPLLARACFGA